MASTPQWAARLGTGIQSAWVRVMRPGVADAVSDSDVTGQALSLAPVVWLLGKVQSGKSSIVRALTGASEAEIGAGFRATTRTARVFDVPADAPVIRFLDTRGLGEAAYDPAEDLAVSEASAHLVLCVMRVRDHEQTELLDVLRAVRRRHPEWPIVVAQTWLHETYPHGAEHPDPYPFGAQGAPMPGVATLPADLIRSLAHQRRLFAELPGGGPLLFVPIDFTRPGDGFADPEYGIEALLKALETAAPASLRTALEAVEAGRGDSLSARAHPHVVGYATAAAAADLVPVAGLVAVPGVQGKMLHALASIYGIGWDRQVLGEFAAAVGTGALVRMASTFGVRELAKLVPVYGQTAGAAAAAAASFATTYALGKAACYFLARKRRGVTDPEGVAAAYREGLTAAFKLARERGFGKTPPSEGAPSDGAVDGDRRRERGHA